MVKSDKLFFFCNELYSRVILSIILQMFMLLLYVSYFIVKRKILRVYLGIYLKIIQQLKIWGERRRNNLFEL